MSDPMSDLAEQSAEVLWQYLKHGDVRHQAWLKKAIYAFFRGEERPEESGIDFSVSNRVVAEPENTGIGEEAAKAAP